MAQGRALLAFNYGVALHHLGRESEALQWFDAAVRDDPTDARYVRTLADAYRGAGREGVADSLFRRLGTLAGGEPQALIGQGWQAMRDGQAATAESLFTLAVQMDENQYGALKDKGVSKERPPRSRTHRKRPGTATKKSHSGGDRSKPC